jgi:hypothetical protein
MPASEGRNVHRATTRVFSVILVALGIAMIVSTIARGGGATALGILLGVLFIAAGIGRLFVLAHTRGS